MIYKMEKSEWISIGTKLPKHLETVWCLDIETEFVFLGCLYRTEEGYLWGISDGLIYSEKDEIVSDCILDDDYEVTHWAPLPKLPK